MKKISTLILFFSFISKSYGQYYDQSYFSAGGYNPFGHSWMHLDDFQSDRYGNRFSLITEQDCYICAIEKYVSWGGPSGSGGFSWTNLTTPNMQMFADGIGDLFMLGTVSSTVTIYGTVINANQKVLIKAGTYAIITNASSVSVNDSGYCFMLRSDSIKLYSPDGVLIWARPGGGSQIYANNNLSYIINTSTGIKKYRENGNLAWQSSFAGAFRVTPHHRIIVKQAGGIVYELSASSGQVLSVHAGSTQGSMMDNEGNGYSYSGNTLTKYDSTGVAWQTHLTGTSFAHIGIDMYDNIYFANNYTSHAQNSYDEWINPPNVIFVPPNLYVNPPSLNGSNWGYYAAYTGRINQQDKLNAKITTGNVKAICKKSTTLVPFTVNQFQVGFENGFRAELSDATGDFSNPIVLGTGTLSPISANTSFFNGSGNKYKIRVVSNNPEVIGRATKVPQFAYPPKGEIAVSHLFYVSGNNPYSCAPATLIASPGNYTYQWFKKLYGINGYITVYNSNDSLTISNSGGDSYQVIITDTATGCPSTGWRTNFYTLFGNVAHPDFFLPDTVPLNNGAIDLTSGYGGDFIGTGVSDNKFYPDSAGAGLHSVQWHTNDPAPCYAVLDTTKFIYVRNYNKPIGSVHISPVKDHYCSNDTVVISFSYDSTLFNASNIFTVKAGIKDNYGFYNIETIGTGQSSPITCIMPAIGYTYNPYDYRVRVVSSSPVYTGAYNYEGSFKIGSYDNANLTANVNNSNCAPVNSLITLAQGSYQLPVYYWHYNGQTSVDTVIPDIDGYLGIPVSHGSSFLATQPGGYSVEIVNEAGCHSFSDTIHVGSAPIATITPDVTVVICAGDSVVLSANTGAGLTYKWKKFANYIAGAMLADYIATTSGNYKVEVTNSNGCSKISGITPVIVNCRKGDVSAEDSDVFNATVFPNPSNGDFNFEFSNTSPGNISFEIFDFVGKSILTATVHGLEFTIHKEQLSAGVYFTLISNRNMQRVLKLVKTD